VAGVVAVAVLLHVVFSQLGFRALLILIHNYMTTNVYGMNYVILIYDVTDENIILLLNHHVYYKFRMLKEQFI
jgi:hypothetical protein